MTRQRTVVRRAARKGTRYQREEIRKAEAQGLEFVRWSNAHALMRNPETQAISIIASTPGDGNRSRENSTAHVKRNAEATKRYAHSFLEDLRRTSGVGPTDEKVVELNLDKLLKEWRDRQGDSWKIGSGLDGVGRYVRRDGYLNIVRRGRRTSHYLLKGKDCEITPRTPKPEPQPEPEPAPPEPAPAETTYPVDPDTEKAQAYVAADSRYQPGHPDPVSTEPPPVTGVLDEELRELLSSRLWPEEVRRREDTVLAFSEAYDGLWEGVLKLRELLKIRSRFEEWYAERIESVMNTLDKSANADLYQGDINNPPWWPGKNGWEQIPLENIQPVFEKIPDEEVREG